MSKGNVSKWSLAARPSPEVDPSKERRLQKRLTTRSVPSAMDEKDAFIDRAQGAGVFFRGLYRAGFCYMFGG